MLVDPFTHPQHMNDLKHLVCVWRGYGNHSMWVWGLNQCNMTSFVEYLWTRTLANFLILDHDIWWLHHDGGSVTANIKYWYMVYLKVQTDLLRIFEGFQEPYIRIYGFLVILWSFFAAHIRYYGFGVSVNSNLRAVISNMEILIFDITTLKFEFKETPNL
jgi:hypothetical protein